MPLRAEARPGCRPAFLEWMEGEQGCSDHTREVGTGWGAQRLLGGARAAIIPVSDAGAKAGRGGRGCGGKIPPAFPTQEVPRTSLSFHPLWGGGRAEPGCPLDSASSGNSAVLRAQQVSGAQADPQLDLEESEAQRRDTVPARSRGFRGPAGTHVRATPRKRLVVMTSEGKPSIRRGQFAEGPERLGGLSKRAQLPR